MRGVWCEPCCLGLTGSDQVLWADAWGHVLRRPAWVRDFGCCARGAIPLRGAVSVSLPCDDHDAGVPLAWSWRGAGVAVLVSWASSSVG